jgi:hypothetical protein
MDVDGGRRTSCANFLIGKCLEEYVVLNMKTGGVEKSDESRTRRDEQRRRYSKMDERGKG